MELFEAIKERHSCRAYLPDEITDEQIKQIIESARLAPSSKNAQPWKFVCIKSVEIIKHISKMLKDYYLKNKDNTNKISKNCSAYATAKIMEEAPAIILIYTDKDDLTFKGFEESVSVLSIGAAIENMMLAATDLELGCLWIADTNYIHTEIERYILEHFKGTQYENFLNEKNILISTMTVGKIAEPRFNRPRKSIDDILCIINN